MQNQQGQKKMSYLQGGTLKAKCDGDFEDAEQARAKRKCIIGRCGTLKVKGDGGFAGVE